VLATQLWLSTHVTTVTIGYGATFLAGAIGIVYIFAGVLTPALADRALRKSVGRMIYGTVCFATLTSFVGTVLGGIWADQSWGRFWGWDPKENGAMLIVLMNALILHARWGGLVQERGMAVLAVLGNIVTAWSWFGVNLLGVGLHSYGFMDRGALWLMGFVACQLLIMAAGMLPLEWWRSYRADEEAIVLPENSPSPA
jgi:ABC-type transport system involved in cytochrome c biogenesis permease subunit